MKKVHFINHTWGIGRVTSASSLCKELFALEEMDFGDWVDNRIPKDEFLEVLTYEYEKVTCPICKEAAQKKVLEAL